MKRIDAIKRIDSGGTFLAVKAASYSGLLTQVIESMRISKLAYLKAPAA